MKTSTKVFIGAGALGALGLLLWKCPFKKEVLPPGYGVRPGTATIRSPYTASRARAIAAATAKQTSSVTNTQAASLRASLNSPIIE